MKLSEMNQRQKQAFEIIVNQANQLTGGLEIMVEDYPKESKEYKFANELLNNHEKLVKTIYENTTSLLPTREINFCGKEWLLERCERRITKLGY